MFFSQIFRRAGNWARKNNTDSVSFAADHHISKSAYFRAAVDDVGTMELAFEFLQMLVSTDVRKEEAVVTVKIGNKLATLVFPEALSDTAREAFLQSLLQSKQDIELN